MTRRIDDPRMLRLVAMFERMAPGDVARLAEYYADDATFKDPFNEVRGVPAVQRIFAHMFEALDEPRFVVHDVIVQGDACFLTWDFLFRFRRGNRRCRWCAADRICGWTARAASRCTATTGTRPRSCTRSCPCSAR